MPIYKYKAINKEGKKTSGLVDAVSEDIAIEIIRDRGGEITSIREEKQRQEIDLPFLNRIKVKDIVIFSRQFSVLISAGVSLVQSLKLMVDQTANLKFKKIVTDVANEVDAGAKLSDSLGKRPEVFSNFYVSVVRSGESSGKLEDVLGYLADEMEKDYDMASKIKGAMIYPIFIFCGLGAVGAIMMIYVVPKLTAIMEETGGELPMATRVLIAVSHFMSGYWWLLLIILAGIGGGIRYAAKTPTGKRLMDIILLKLPIFGRLFHRIYLVRFSRSLSTLLVGGVSLSKGLEITANVVSNSVYRHLIDETRKEVEDGNSLAMVFSESKDVPIMVSQMLAIGEKTGKLDVILGRITDFYTREINNMVANLMTLMEPIIMVFLGVGVGMMVAAIIMPMYNMANQF